MQNVSRSGGRQVADVLGTIALLIAHFVFFLATVVGLGLMVMVTDSCGSQKCGDPAWRQRVAWVVPLLGCVAQLAVALAAAAMALQAGPV